MKTTQELVNGIVNGIVNDETIINHLICLDLRWKDEKKYEDWSNYIESMKIRFDKINVLTGTKRPFGFTCSINDNIIHVFLKKRRTYTTLAAKLI